MRAQKLRPKFLPDFMALISIHDFTRFVSKGGKKPQLDLSKIESEEKDLDGNGSIARVENSSGENA
jgi:hypothetical protein